jgi:tetratricopeptide (TPR) repeat protein
MQEQNAYAVILDAEAVFTRAIDLEKDNPDAWPERGIVRIHRAAARTRALADPARDLEAAEQDLTESLRRNPGSGETWASRGRDRRERGLVSELSGRPREAGEEYRRAISDYEEAARIDAGETVHAREALRELRDRCARPDVGK